MKKVMVINEDPDFQQLMKSYLQRHGFVPEVVNHNEPVVVRVQEFQPDVIVLDVEQERDRMICRQLQERRLTETARLVLLTDFDIPPELNCSPDAIIRKPFEPQEFIERIKALA
jgi:two-component system alkaline phosphatase synthesis response regulator PhoP